MSHPLNLRSRRRVSRRRPIIVGCIVATLLQAMLPPTLAFAGGCGVTDPGACMDGMHYSLWYGLAGWLWKLDAMLLQLAYSIEQLRVWIIETAFSSVYQSLSRVLSPFIVPFATLALLMGLLLFFLMPITGKTRLMNVRHVLMWTTLAPLALTATGQLLSQVEQGRVTIGAAIFTEVSKVLPGDIFGVRASDMRRPTPLYGSGNPCGAGLLKRPGQDVSQTTLRMDDLAASLLWANAQDIHCPQYQAPGQDVPDAFYLDPPDGPKYAIDQDVGDMSESSDRKAAIANMQRGVGRLALGIFPCILAALEACVQLLFGLALVAIWVGVPLALLFIFFEDSSASMVILFRQGVEVLTASWKSSVFLAMVFAALVSSAEMGNAGAYIGFSLGSMLVVISVLGQAGGLFRRSLGSFKASTMLGFAGSAGGFVAGAVTGAVAGTAATATVAAAAHRQSGGNLRYTAGSVLGRIASKPGEVAASLGLIKNEEVLAGLNAGGRSHHSVRAMRTQMQSDARRTNAEGITLREAAQERRLARRVERIQQPGDWQKTRQRSSALGQAVTYMTDGSFDDDVASLGSRAINGVQQRWQALKAAPASFAGAVRARVPAPRAGAAGKLQLAAAGVDALHDRLHPDRRYHAYALSQKGRIVTQPPVPLEELPAGAQTVERAKANMPRLLRQGYIVQPRRDGQLSYWRPAAQQTSQAQPDALSSNTAAAQRAPAPRPRVTRQLTAQLPRRRQTSKLTVELPVEPADDTPAQQSQHKETPDATE